MIKYIVVAAPAACALLLTFLSKKAASAVFKESEPGEESIFKIKMTALLIGILAFALAVVLF